VNWALAISLVSLGFVIGMLTADLMARRR